MVIPGEQQSPAVHLAAIAINQALGNVGKTVVYTETVNPMPSIQGDDIVTLVNDIKAGKVDWLLILNANPVYTAPVDLHFEQAIAGVKTTTAHLGSHFNETAVVTEWHINGAHYLENWSDTRAYDGTATVVQPMIDPLYNGKSAHEVIQSMLDDPDTSPYDAVRKTWQANLTLGQRRSMPGARYSTTAWSREAAYQPKTVSAKIGDLAVTRAQRSGRNGRSYFPRRSQHLRRALCECWLAAGNSQAGHQHVLGQRRADELSHAGENSGWRSQDVVAIESNGNTVMAPVFAVPGHPDGSVTLYLGYARRNGGPRCRWSGL